MQPSEPASLASAPQAGTAGRREGRRIRVGGIVQGVGFRPWVYRTARELGLAGRVWNSGAGVCVEVFGEAAALERLLERLAAPELPAASVERLDWTPIPPQTLEAFSIVASRDEGRREIALSPDLATCPRCLQELADPRDRRHGYAFTNCTACGPRYTIALGLPYDRTRTSMRVFELCPDCEEEYAHPEDRRFHAEPNACPRCGPRLRLLGSDGREIAGPGSALAKTAALLRRGAIVAIRGIGGVHLACDAAREEVVAELRKRKHRDRKPFAVMVRDLEDAARVAEVEPAEAALLCSPAAPIVLVARRREGPVAEGVAPGNPRLGVLLAYAPVHHLLLQAFGGPLVMTSGNPSGDPIATRTDDALERLDGVADAFLVHDREIVSGCDDSVVRVIAGKGVVLRRSRGYVPRPLPLARPLRHPILACGAQMKNAFCLAGEGRAILGPHQGDLESPESLAEYERSIARMERLLDFRPEVVVHDLHPLYASTRYALDRPETVKVAVQHHHAHVVSAMAEHGIEGPVLGVAFDGTGLGTDGTMWGGEVLRADLAGFERLATLRPIPLVGGDLAIRQVWRIALAVLEDAFEGDPPLEEIPLFRRVAGEKLRAVRGLLRRGAASVPAHGLGRYFDALGALLLARDEAAFQGDVAMSLEFAADGVGTLPPYPYGIEEGAAPWQVDLRPCVRGAVRDLLAGRPPGEIAARFHRSVASATAALLGRLQERDGRLPVVLTGGCFQNRRLAEGLLRELDGGPPVLLHRRVPPGDGGLALGQALVADAQLRGDGKSRCV